MKISWILGLLLVFGQATVAPVTVAPDMVADTTLEPGNVPDEPASSTVAPDVSDETDETDESDESDESEDDDDDDEDEDKFYTREIEVEIEEDSAKFESEGGDGSKLEAKISNDGGVKVKVELETSDGVESSSVFRLESLVEYEEVDGVAGYNPETDNEVSTRDLSSLTWAFACEEVSLSYYSCSMSSDDLHFTFHVVADVVRRTGIPDLLPNGVEFDASFSKTTANPVAFICRYEAEVEIDDDHDDHDSNTEAADDVETESLKVGGSHFTFLTTATVDGAEIPVHNFDLGGKEFTFAFVTNATGTVSWDPFVGANFRTATASGADPLAPAGLIVSTATALLASVLYL